MKRQRRTFTREFKTEIVKQILLDKSNKDLISKRESISIPLLERWTNDYVAQTKKISLVQNNLTERRKNYSTEQELKAKIADLYMIIDRLKPISYNQAMQKGA